MHTSGSLFAGALAPLVRAKPVSAATRFIPDPKLGGELYNAVSTFPAPIRIPITQAMSRARYKSPAQH
jgi:hypothetical protein